MLILDKDGNETLRKEEITSADGRFLVEMDTSGIKQPNVTGMTLELAKSLCTVAEKTAFEAGTISTMKLRLEVKSAGALMTDEVVALATNALSQQKGVSPKGAKYMDISLYLQVGTAPEKKITSLGGKTISVVLDVPEDMQNKDGNVIRTFYVVHVVSTTKADVIAETTSNSVPFVADGFSVYTLAYVDKNKPSGSSSSTASSGSTTVAVTTVSPKTYGEDATDKLLLLMGTISAIIAIAAKVYDFKRRKEEE